jgi:hypothetical protein
MWFLYTTVIGEILYPTSNCVKHTSEVLHSRSREIKLYLSADFTENFENDE